MFVVPESTKKYNDFSYKYLKGNRKAVDNKKLNARFMLNGMQPPSSFRNIDTKILAKRYFGFTSNKLAYLTDKLCKKYKKLN